VQRLVFRHHPILPRHRVVDPDVLRASTTTALIRSPIPKRNGWAEPSLYLDRAGDNNGLVDVMAMAREERAEMAEMADFLASLRVEQWDHPSLCGGWRVRDVAAHVVSYVEHGWADLITRLAKARFRPGRLNEVALADYAVRDPQELVEFLLKHLTPRGATARFGGRVGLVDALIHHQDMRRPLGMRRQTSHPEFCQAATVAVSVLWCAQAVCSL